MTTLQTTSPITIALSSPREPAALSLLQALDDHLTSLYPPDANYLFSVDALCEPNAAFFLAQQAGRAVGCAAVVCYAGYAEVKRVFVPPDCRGMGIAKRLMTTLEERALAQGYDHLRLETGIHQPDAIALYERVGYQRRGPFGDYPDILLSVFMEKALAPR